MMRPMPDASAQPLPPDGPTVDAPEPEPIPVPEDDGIRADDRGAPPLLLRDLRRRPGPQGQPGLRLRRPVAAGRVRRRRRRRPRRHRFGGGGQRAAPARRGARHRPTCSPGSPTGCTRPTSRSPARSTATPPSAAPARRRRSPSSTGTGSPSATSATPAATSSAAASSPRSRPTTRSCRASSTRAGSAEEEARIHPHRNLILKALDGLHEVEPDLFAIALAPGDRVFLCSDGACGVLEDTRMADILSSGSPEFCAIELVRASLDAGSSDNVTCVVADVLTEEQAAADPAYDDLEPMIVGAAAELKQRTPRGLFRGHRSGDTGELEPVDAEIPDGIGYPIMDDPPVDQEAYRYAPRPPRRFTWLRRVMAARGPARAGVGGAGVGVLVDAAAVLRRRARGPGRGLPRHRRHPRAVQRLSHQRPRRRTTYPKPHSPTSTTASRRTTTRTPPLSSATSPST